MATGETVELLLEESSTIHGSLAFYAVADASGNFVNQDFIVEQDDTGVMFTLTTTGQSSGLKAQTMFTDSVVAVDNAASAATTGSGSTTLSIPLMVWP